MTTAPPLAFRCPRSRLPLRKAQPRELDALNAWLATRPAIVLGDGTPLAPPWPAAWRAEGPGGGFYPEIHGIPLLVPDAMATGPAGPPAG